jgi:hypothetical protein
MQIGLVYKFTAERAGRQSLDDLMKSSLYLMRSELREIPPRNKSVLIVQRHDIPRAQMLHRAFRELEFA